MPRPRASEAGDIDLLVNAGIYREDNLAEPALAAMIQEDIGANPGHPPREGAHGTFSFDVANGGCGVLTALELLDGFVRSGTIQTGLVVASDSDPGASESFPFPAVGGAMLVRPAERRRGLRRLRVRDVRRGGRRLRERHQLAREGAAPPPVEAGEERADGRARRRVRVPGDRVRRGSDAPVPRAARARREHPSTSRSSASRRWGSRTASRRGSTSRRDASRASPTSSGARTRRAPSPHSTPRSSRGSSPRRGRSSSRPWARASWWGSRCIGSDRASLETYGAAASATRSAVSGSRPILEAGDVPRPAGTAMAGRLLGWAT